MSYREEVLRQALALPPADRAFVAAALEESLAALEPSEPTDAASADAVRASALLAELQRRSAAYKNGEMTARPAAEIIAELRAAPLGGQGR